MLLFVERKQFPYLFPCLFVERKENFQKNFYFPYLFGVRVGDKNYFIGIIRRVKTTTYLILAIIISQKHN